MLANGLVAVDPVPNPPDPNVLVLLLLFVEPNEDVLSLLFNEANGRLFVLVVGLPNTDRPKPLVTVAGPFDVEALPNPEVPNPDPLVEFPNPVDPTDEPIGATD